MNRENSKPMKNCSEEHNLKTTTLNDLEKIRNKTNYSLAAKENSKVHRRIDDHNHRPRNFLQKRKQRSWYQYHGLLRKNAAEVQKNFAMAAYAHPLQHSTSNQRVIYCILSKMIQRSCNTHAFGRIAFIALPIVSIGTNNSTIRALSCYTWIMPRLKLLKQIEQLPSFTMKGCNAKLYTV